MTVRDVLLLVAAAFLVIAFLVMSDGCLGYTSEDNVPFACMDPSGVGQVVGQAAHMLFAGLAILSVALLDHATLFRRDTAGD